MRVVLTTVKEAKVNINGRTVGQIGRGYLLLTDFTDGDSKETVDRMIDKILSLRVFPDEHGQINISLQDISGSILSVSQFTLYANTRGGRRPSFVDALRPGEAEPLWDYMNEQLEAKYGRLSTGVFGADMDVYSLNEGPFTLLLDSKELFNE